MQNQCDVHIYITVCCTDGMAGKQQKKRDNTRITPQKKHQTEKIHTSLKCNGSDSEN